MSTSMPCVPLHDAMVLWTAASVASAVVCDESHFVRSSVLSVLALLQVLVG